jgi:RNA polymerase sigma factor (sigma-70 family)
MGSSVAMQECQDQAHRPAAAARISQYLGAHDFRDLFIDAWGWDYAKGSHSVRVHDHEFLIEAIAQKRGFQVVRCSTDRFTLINRPRLRAIQKQLSKIIHEHIIIYTHEQPCRQVWQWGLRSINGAVVRYLEHPFFSESPPQLLLSRLEHLRFALDDEDVITLLDAVERAQRVLDVQPEFALFSKSPEYAELSDRAARAMKLGGIQEFHKFILLHERLISWCARKWHRRYAIAEDEAGQLFAIGIMKAAKLFDPDRGFQFATYGACAAKRTCRRLAAEIRYPIHFPQYVFSPCNRVRGIQERVLVESGPQAARETVERNLAEEVRPIGQAWTTLERLANCQSLSDRRNNVFRAACLLPSRVESPCAPLLRSDTRLLVHDALKRLAPREREIARRRYGFDGEPETLQAIGDALGLTRERIRQIVDEISKSMRMLLDTDPEELRDIL